MMKRNKGGFTLIELMVVVIIVGILAAVAIPIYRTNVRKAAASEGAALVGAVLTAEKVYYAETDTYTGTTGNLSVDIAGNKYFTSYALSGASAAGFTATAIGPSSGVASGVNVVMTYTNAAGATITYPGL